MVKGYIYRHWIINDKGIEKSYIGQTINELEIRWQGGKGYTTFDTRFSKAIKKYGWNNFHHEIVTTVERETKEELKVVLNTLEKAYIELYNSFNNGYNSTTGGDSYLLSDEAKNKIGESHKKEIVCLNTGDTFKSMVDAYEWATGRLDRSVQKIGHCCLGKLKTAHRHPETRERLIWVFVEDYNKMTQNEIDERLEEVRGNVVYFNDLDENTIDKQDMTKLALDERLETIYKILSPGQTYVFNEYFLQGNTMEEVAKRHNVTTTRINNLKNQIIKKITNTYTVNEFYKLLEIK